MKVTDVVKGRRSIGTIQERVFRYLKEHPDEVFGYRDEGLAQELDVKLSALSFTLWALLKKGSIGKQDVRGKTYIGSHEAITRLRRDLNLEEPDPITLAWENLQRIRLRTGNVDSLRLLDEVRGGPLL